VRNDLSIVLALVLSTGLALGPARAGAQAPSRAARVLTLAGDGVGVLVARDRVFVPDAAGALSVCSGSRCAPVRSTETCTVPRCPGTGTLLVLESAIADVSDMPTDRDGFNRVVGEWRSDPALAGIAWSFGTHPDPMPQPSGPVRWVERPRIDHFDWQLDALGIGGVLASNGLAVTGGEASFGFRFMWEAHDDGDDFLGIVFGNVLGLDLRVRAMALVPTQGPESWATTIGIAPAMGYGLDHEIFLLPAVYSVFVPEFGVALREARDAVWYAGWSLPIAFLIDAHTAIEARASVMLIDDWIPGDDTEVLVSFGLGILGR
jgi:hypothetical protein